MNSSSFSKEKKLIVNSDVKEIEIDLYKPRLIPISGLDKKGKKITRHLKITDKCKMVLI